MNDRIDAKEVRLIDAEGNQLGILPIANALSQAKAKELDLVEVAPQAKPPVCRLMDYSKYRYEQEQKEKRSKKKQTAVVVKEMKFRPKINTHDFEIKKGHVIRFLEGGAKVKITIMFRGRELAYPELGKKLLDRLAEELVEQAKVENAPKQDGRNMVMVLAPVAKTTAKVAAAS